MLYYRKQSGGMRFSLLPLLMGFLLMGVLGFSTTYAIGDPVAASSKVDTVKVQLANKTLAKQDTVALSTPILINVNKVNVGDTIEVTLGTSFKFAKSGPYYVDSMKSKISVDSARVSTGLDTLYIVVKNTTTTNDSISIAGVRVVPATVSASRWGDYTDVNASYFYNGSKIKVKAIKLLPGYFYKYSASLSLINSSIVAGDSTHATGTNVTLVLQDYNNNAALDSTVVPNVKGSLSGSAIAPGTGTVLSSLYSRTFNNTTNSIVMDLGYTKTDKTFYFAFVAPSDTVFTTLITVNPGDAANISTSLLSGKLDTFTVDGSTGYLVTVTDKYFNPTPGVPVSATEAINHGGSATTTSSSTNALGQDTVNFVPSKFYVGSDSLQITAGDPVTATYYTPMTITAGSLGGIIVDYAGTASGTATTEEIAAGTTVYARGFLRDTYGNPINASSASKIAFSINGVNGKGASLGTAALTDAITESQYPNTSKTAVGVTIPYTVSTNFRGAGKTDSVLATVDGYSLTIQIQNRSNVPAKLKLAQAAGVGDSSVVASEYNNAIMFTDTAWDAYGNKVVAPSKDYKIAPTYSSYAIYYTTSGLAKFKGTPSTNDTTNSDTLSTYTNGYVLGTLYSGTKSGVDTLKTWSAASSTVIASVPFYVTPDTYSKLVVTPSIDTIAIAGKADEFIVEKQDQFGNHIDFGIDGGILIGNTYSRNHPSSPNADSDAVTFKIIKSRANTSIDSTIGLVGKASKYGASVDGNLDYKFSYTSAPASADTAKFSVLLYSIGDTITVRSIPTGALASFKVTLSDTTETAGKTISMTVVPYDANNNRMYTYTGHGQILTLNHTAVSPIKGKESTYFFTYENSHSEIDTTTSVLLSDTAFVNGTATFTIHKFAAEQDSMTTITFADTSANVSVTTKPFNFTPDIVDTTYGMWKIQVADTLKSTGSFNFTVTPCDQFGNVNRTEQVIVNISSNQTSGFNIGSNPKVITGPTLFDGTLSGAKGNMVIYVFNSGNSNMFTQSSPIAIDVLNGIDKTNELPKEYALMQNYPNPFNPTTLIKYDLPKAGLVTLKVYDLLGREVATLINGNQAAGKYSVQFNASKLASGVYIYRIQSNNFSAVKKLMLLK